MSRAMRKQMFTLVNLLEQANKTLLVNLMAKHMNEDGVRQLLIDCQETTLTIGNELDFIYGEGTDVVQKLEEYHESLYQLTLVLKHSEKRSIQLKELTNQIKQIRKLLDVQIPDKLEVVFLPYRASMWKFLEHLWTAAKNDKECDTYVVPIPYYNRNPDGAYTKYHYEGDKLPSHVQVTHYENFNLQKRWPDTVFIQNPYDDTDSEISVDPRFYSPELKNIAETLIYVPPLLPENFSTEEGDVHEYADSYMAPGILNADMVIVGSENMKQRYINILAEVFGESARKDWENKIFSIRSYERNGIQEREENEEK